MVNSAYNYASRLKKNNNKGPLGLDELFDTNKQVVKKVNLLYEYLSKSNNTIVHTGILNTLHTINIVILNLHIQC